ncbi:CLUMA_CG000705, isoform A [Clunio marinus]|uniref:CLUMA_CG000705, isoform A n=1 Tax=Clunio marinus TaxID=568069 RepID=A0A1J1HFV5_9DIPT|nr:CLUMA_CG000705, isoform A [Clunio marinus]
MSLNLMTNTHNTEENFLKMIFSLSMVNKKQKEEALHVLCNYFQIEIFAICETNALSTSRLLFIVALVTIKAFGIATCDCFEFQLQKKAIKMREERRSPYGIEMKNAIAITVLCVLKCFQTLHTHFNGMTENLFITV